MKAKKCVVCYRTSETLKKFEEHHTDYENDITICLCYQCHCWAHGKAAVIFVKDPYGKKTSRTISLKNHPFNKEFGRDMAPLAFAERYVKAHKESFK